MDKILNCRRSIVSLFAIICLTMMGMYGMMHGLNDVAGIAMSIAGICGALSGANAFEGSKNGTTDGVRRQPPMLPKPDSPD